MFLILILIEIVFCVWVDLCMGLLVSLGGYVVVVVEMLLCDWLVLMCVLGLVVLVIMEWWVGMLKVWVYDGDLVWIVLLDSVDWVWLCVVVDLVGDLMMLMKGFFVSECGGNVLLYWVVIVLVKLV